jgi:hypothetical protein
MKRTNIIWLLIILIGLALIISSIFGFKISDITKDRNIPDGAVPIAPARDFANCKVSGDLIFRSQNSYNSTTSFFEYENIDNDVRLIFWKIEPEVKVDVDIGPNMFSGLNVPDGKERISLVFYDIPSEKEYTLTASVSYGVNVKAESGNLVEKTVYKKCDGSAKVKIEY